MKITKKYKRYKNIGNNKKNIQNVQCSLYELLLLFSHEGRAGFLYGHR